MYRFNRLPFGVKPAPGVFQQCMDALIAGIDGTVAYLDDLLVTGRIIGEYNGRLEAVIEDSGPRTPSSTRQMRFFADGDRLPWVRHQRTRTTPQSRRDQSYPADARSERCQSTSHFSRTHQFLRKLRQ
ncbi:hypothetical protein RB195_018708 [Necator americanus]|uniref:Reverse transcriptase domain-containing protein n=1 Tax=Necator americanus TaxID=51031 RepID=A0ABR1CAY3_NECAM